MELRGPRMISAWILATALSPASMAAESVGWRMDGDGRFLDAAPPVAWSTTENVEWKTPMPSWSNASPVLVEERSLVLVLSEPDVILAVDSRTGEVAWQDSMGDLAGGRVKAHKSNGWTSATPVSDGTRVFSVYGSGIVASHSLDGERLWARSVQRPDHRWGSSASPVLAGGHLVVQRVDLLALDPETGEEIWRADSDPRWGSPAVARVDTEEVVITPAGDVFRASDGEKLASAVGSLDYATPVVQDGRVYFIEKRATAVRLPKSLDGSYEKLWQSRIQGSRHYASPVIHGGRIYALSREQRFSILDAETGALLHERALDLDSESGANSAYPSITLAGDKLFSSTENGTTAVIEPGDSYREIARSEVEGFRSSPVFAGNRMYLRAFDYLYCIRSGG
ncbi:MAG: PQQ-like beta-propeller repeat protein [Holophagales bacterium]|nr:PQQ-like beta-propeller repeat protein [Holophagales bacterium]